MKTKDLQFVKGSLAEFGLGLDEKQPNDTYLAALVIVSALICGTSAVRLSKFTKLPVEFVQAIRRRMMAAELWTDVDVNCNHWFSGTDQVSTSAITADLLVAEGALVRGWDETTGDYRYWLAEYAPASGHRQRPN